MVKGELTFDDYLEKKFFVTVDFKCYRYDKTGDLIELRNKITEDTFQKINSQIAKEFFTEVEKRFLEIKTRFDKYFSTHYDQEYLLDAEKNTIEQILRGQKNSIVDSFGVTHIVIKYINGMPIVENESLKLSPAFNINTTTLSDIRKYMANEYGLKASHLFFIKNQLYTNKYKPYVMAEVFVKYLDFLKQSAPKPKLAVPRSISFSLVNYPAHFDSWNANHDNQLTEWIKSGLIIEIEKGLFINKKILQEQKEDIDRLFVLLDVEAIIQNKNQQEIKINYSRKVKKVRSILNDFFTHIDNKRISKPLSALCPKIVEQPVYILETIEKYPDNIPDFQKTYYRYNYLYSSRLNFAVDQYHHYKNELLEEVRKELSNGNKKVVSSVFLFMEQFIDELQKNNVSRFRYFESPLFETLFSEVINFKAYYTEVYGHFNFPNIKKIEESIGVHAKSPKGIRTFKTGFNSKLSVEKIELLWQTLIADNFIADDTALENFKAIFSMKELPKDFIEVRWVHLNKRKNPNQTSLREFLKVCMVFKTKQPDQQIIDNCIRDAKGKKIVLSGFKKDNYTLYYRHKFISILNQ
ncbi:MAG: hypothetical protein L3J83_04450 [Proteobacteria bacterium]|nr:hypothetical protein [Pseudomonadota bacterium]